MRRIRVAVVVIGLVLARGVTASAADVPPPASTPAPASTPPARALPPPPAPCPRPRLRPRPRPLVRLPRLARRRGASGGRGCGMAPGSSDVRRPRARPGTVDEVARARALRGAAGERGGAPSCAILPTLSPRCGETTRPRVRSSTGSRDGSRLRALVVVGSDERPHQRTALSDGDRRLRRRRLRAG